MAQGRRATSDIGTVLLHAILLGAIVVLVATGLRIASDDVAHAWLRSLDLVLPSRSLWLRHMTAAVVLTAALAGWAVYVVQARLTPRMRLDRARLSVIARGGRARWSALNVVVVWSMLAALAVLIVSGVLMYLGADRDWSAVHVTATWWLLASSAMHVGLHLAYGGVAQLMRIVRPARLVVAPPPPDLAELLAEEIGRRQRVPPPLPPSSSSSPPPPMRASPSPLPPTMPETSAAHGERDVRAVGGRAPTGVLHAHPLASALAAMLVVSAVGYAGEVSTRQTLRVHRVAVAQAPRLDGDLSDAAWRNAVPQRVVTTHGGDFGGGGQSDIEIRALHDDSYLYLAITWSDPTRSLKHLPLVKTADGWRVAEGSDRLGEEGAFHEDKFSVLLANGGLPLIGAAIHLARQPVADRPPGATGRGLHYLDAGLADVWQWRATHTGPHGLVENCRFGAPAQPTAQQVAGGTRYAGGIVCEERPAFAQSNVIALTSQTREGGVRPSRLPRELAAMAAAMGPARASAQFSDSEGGRWWMTLGESRPYTVALDRQIPVGTLIPSVLVPDTAPQASSIRAAARWAAGRWTLELVRRLDTGSDTDIAVRSGVLMWLAAFDHSETRHTRHLRPLTLEID